MSQFDEYVYTIPKSYHSWGSTIASPRGYFHGNESMWGSKLNMGFTVYKQEALMEYPHFHQSVEEYYMFLGPDLTKVFDFDADIDIWLGEDPDHMEKFTITKPSLVRVPPSVWHGPINFRRIGKPAAFSSMYFEGDLSKITRRIKPDGSVEYPYIGSNLRHCVFDKTKSCMYCGKCVMENMKEFDSPACEDSAVPRSWPHHPDLDFAYEWARKVAESEPAPRSGKLDQCIFEFPVEYHNWGDTFANPRAKFRGVTQMPGAKFFGGFSVVLKPNIMEIPHIHHANDEYLWFIGANLNNMFDFDAEIEVSLGLDPDNMKKIVITEPTVIRVPPNTWHCPINFKRIDKPVAFLPVYPDGDWSKIVRQKDENGNDEFIFEAASLRHCIYHPERLCSYCGKCFQDRKAKMGGAQTPDTK